MSQPQWELIYATDYSALYRDTTGVYDPELMIAQTVDDADEDDIEATAAVVYRFPLKRCWQVIDDDGTWYLTEQNPTRAAELPHGLRAYQPWYADDLRHVADSVGCELSGLVADLCSDDPKMLAGAFEAIGGYHGYDNLDSYPEEWTTTEFEQWPERGVKLSTDERDAFTKGYISCALWCGVMTYKHDDDCPCHQRAKDGDPYDDEDCTCSSELTSDGDGYDENMLNEAASKQLTDDAHEFYAANVADLRASTLDMERCGHDFWLTRNRHGAGFWGDKGRGADADAALDRLTKASHAYGEASLILGADGKIDNM